MILRNLGIILVSGVLLVALIVLVVTVRDAAHDKLLEKRQGCATYETGSTDWNTCIDKAE